MLELMSGDHEEGGIVRSDGLGGEAVVPENAEVLVVPDVAYRPGAALSGVKAGDVSEVNGKVLGGGV
jgi:hypothetical protein